MPMRLGERRAGRWARGEVRRQHRSFLRRNVWKLLAFAIYAAVVSALPIVLLPDEVKGFAAGVASASVVWLVVLLVAQASGTSPRSMGAAAEEWTSQVLRKLPSTRWQVVDHISLKAGDIDHVLIGPGGVCAIETKWSAQEPGSRWSRASTETAVRQAQRNARRLRALLRSVDIQVDTQVTPLVVLWGKRRTDTPREISGATVVGGDHLKDWVTVHGTGPLDEASGERAFQGLRAWVERRDAYSNRLSHERRQREPRA